MVIKGRNKRKRVMFEMDAPPDSKVFLTGTFSGWKEKGKKMKDETGNGRYKAVVMLEPGRHEYKFVVDGEWCADPHCADRVQNEHGTQNSVVEIN